MFATLHYSLEDDEMTCGELTDKLPCLNQPFSHSACLSCRDKKLKCTGQKSGCDRCQKRGITCQYAPASGDARTKRRKNQRAPSPHSTSSSSSSSNGVSSSTKCTAIEFQEDANSRQPNNKASDAIAIQTDEPMSASVPSTVAGAWDGNGMVSPSAATLSPSQMPYPDFTMDDITVDDVLNFSYELTAFNADFSSPKPTDCWQETRTTLADYNSLTPIYRPNNQTQLLLESNFSHRCSPDFRKRERSDSSRSSGSPSSGTSLSTRTDSRSASLPACSCRDTALQILEALQPQRKRRPTHAILQQLHFTKSIINECQVIINCATCIKVSGLMVLVGVISENLMDVLEAVMLDWESKNLPSNLGYDLQRSVHAWNIDAGPTEAIHYNCIFGDYKVDTVEEWLAMAGCLLLFQINRLDEILVRLQNNAIAADWESHLIILQPVFQRLKSIKDKL